MRAPYHYYCELYLENFYFCPGYTDEEIEACIWNNLGFQAKINVTKDPTRLACCIDATSEDGPRGIIIWTKEDRVSAATLSSLSHEVVHAVNKIFKWKDINPDVHNDEPQAYLHGWLMRKICESLFSLRGTYDIHLASRHDEPVCCDLPTMQPEIKRDGAKDNYEN